MIVVGYWYPSDKKISFYVTEDQLRKISNNYKQEDLVSLKTISIQEIECVSRTKEKNPVLLQEARRLKHELGHEDILNMLYSRGGLLGVRISSCTCKLIPRSLLQGSKDLVLVQKHTCGFICRMLEDLYEKCAGYNLRYCPLRRVSRCDKSLSVAVKDILILVCFLIANFVVFLNIITKTALHVYYIVKESIIWIGTRSFLKSANCEPFYFKPQTEHDFTPPTKRFDMF